MALHWVVDAVSGKGAPLNDAAAREAAADGALVYPYDNQDGGLGGYGIDPNAGMPHQITADKVLVYNANTNRYEWMSGALVAAQQAATGQYNAQTSRAATVADIIAASRGPENAFQYSNALHGQADASGVGIFDVLAGRIGGATTAGTPDQQDLHGIDIMGRVNAIINRSMGTGGENGAGSSAWAEQAGMAPTQKEQQAQGVLQDAAQTPQAGQAAASADGTRISAPYDPPTYMRHGPNTSSTPGTYISAPYDPGTPPTAVRHGPNTSSTPGTYISAPYDPPPRAQVAGAVPTVNALGLPMNALGKVDTGQYARLSGISGSGDSDIAHVNKSHNLISSRGYGKGSDARNRAHAAAGMRGEEFDRIIKHGGDPFKRNTGMAEGGTRVVTGPQTIRVGEGGKDELIQVTPLERTDQPIPRAIMALANSLSPDLDGQRGVGGVTDGMTMHDYGGPPIPEQRYVLPQLGGAGGSAHGGWTGVYPPATMDPLDPRQTVPIGPVMPPSLQRGRPLGLAEGGSVLAMDPAGMGGPLPDPMAGGSSVPPAVGPFDPSGPQQSPEALAQIAAILQSPPGPMDGPLELAVRANWALGQDGMPQFIGGAQAPVNPRNIDPLANAPMQNPDGSLGMAAGGGLAVLGGSASVRQANSPADAAGQVTVPYGRGTRQYPASRTTPMPNFGALPPALLSLIPPSDWKLIGSQYGAAGGNAADIPFLLQRSLKGLGRAPATYGGKVY